MLLCFLIPAFLLAQEEQNKSTKEVEKIYADLGVGELLAIGKNKVNFIRVISDSRCPKQVTCIWPGEARILIGIEKNGKYLEKELVVSGSGAEIPLGEDIVFQFTHLSPYPVSGAKIAAEDYCLSFSALLPAGD